MFSLSFRDLRVANSTRCLRWHPSGLNEWSVNDWIVAVGGEVGEALNVVKKLNRERDGQPGNTKAGAELLSDLADELSDALIYLDILLASVGEDHLGSFTDCETLADLRALSVRELGETAGILRSSDYGAGLMAASGALARRAVDSPHLIAHAAEEVLKAIDGIAWHYDIDLSPAAVRKFNATSERHGFPERLTGGLQ